MGDIQLASARALVGKSRARTDEIAVDQAVFDQEYGGGNGGTASGSNSNLARYQPRVSSDTDASDWQDAQAPVSRQIACSLSRLARRKIWNRLLCPAAPPCDLAKYRKRIHSARTLQIGLGTSTTMLVTNFKLKYVIYKIVCAFYQLGDVGRIHPMRERSLRALQRTTDYIERAMPDAVGFEVPAEVLAFALDMVKIEGHYLEFGVFTGGTIRFIARKIGDRTIHGFDSFQGLPEDWSGYNLGQRAFDAGGRMPKVPSNVRLYGGWFEDSIPPWLDANPGPVAFIHVDCDLYESTRTIFTHLADRIVPGTIILFDEYFNYPNWEQHEFKAFQEFIRDRAVRYRYLGFSRQQVAVRVEAIGDRSV